MQKFLLVPIFPLLIIMSCNNPVTIGNQEWKLKNLDTINYRNGDVIPEVEDGKAWAALTTGAWCYYNHNPINGKLYNWYAVNDPRKLAPAGWHIPTAAEWATMSDNLGGLSIAGGALKEASSIWTPPNTGATNSSLFSALPDGHRFYDGTFYELHNYGYWWTATEAAPQAATYYSMNNTHANLYTSSKDKREGLSVRCIKD